MRLRSEKELRELAQKARTRILPATPYVSVGLGTCGLGSGAGELFEALRAEAAAGGFTARKAGCFGFCAAEPVAMVYRPARPLLVLARLKPKDAAKLAEAARDEAAFDRLAAKALCKVEEWDFRTSFYEFGHGYDKLPAWNELPFFKGQEKIVLRDAGLIDPESIEDYIAAGGYGALAKALGSMRPEEVVAEVSAARLRGRGGAGFSTGRKWELMRAAPGEEKYVICNADEGDPGAYMNRNEIESDPHMLVEGMVIGAYAMGAAKGFVYIRAEYPLAVERLGKAVAEARARGLLGADILGSGFSFDLDLVEGAGAFVCGEETALMASAEGRPGRALPRPPFPAQRGYLGKPSTINNVETWCNVPVILAKGAAWFAGFGTDKSPGTKVFSLVGKIKNTGLVELPLGTPLDAIVYGMGEGTGSRKRIRAVQTGGPSGGCIPAGKFSTPVDYESLNELGAIMGSGGMVVMDQDNCMVDVARYFVDFTAGESCGKCAPCREGLAQSKRILDAVARGAATMEDIDTLAELAETIRDSALCGLGQTSANPVLTTIKYFRDEYEAHIQEKRCAAGVCSELYIALCENSCPLHLNIPGYLQLLKEGRLEEAFELTLRGNPLPGTLGRICHFHCQMRCRRDDLDGPVHQGEIHRYLADTVYKMGREKAVYERIAADALPRTPFRVAVVGAGPAGLAAAYFLARLGHEVTVYDEHQKPGGILRYGIPAYRLPKEVLDKELGVFKALGVKFECGRRAGADLDYAELEEGHDAVLLCVGATEDLPLGIPGESLAGVHHGYRFLEEYAAQKKNPLGKKVVIVGAGNVAIDAARTALRLGAEATVVYRREKRDMPANADELLGAEEEGVQFRFLASPRAVVDDGQGRVAGLSVMRMAAGGIDESGRRKPVATGKTETIPCDTILVAVGERVGAAAAQAAGVATERGGTIRADKHSLAASRRKFFAAGDAVLGPSTAAEAMGMAKQAAFGIDLALTGERRAARLERRFSYADEVPGTPQATKPLRPARLPPGERLKNFIEINAGYSGEDARQEAERCLRCDVRESGGGCAKAAAGGLVKAPATRDPGAKA